MKLRKAAAELRRGMALARSGGPSAGLRFVGEEVVGNVWLRCVALIPQARGDGVRCNLCGWRGRRFLTHCAVGYVNRNAFCPRCRSYSRHRGFAWLWSEHLAASFAHLRTGPGLKLAFAPEQSLVRLLEVALGPIAGAGLRLRAPEVTHREDLQHLSFADGSVDFVSCFHVLEHVPDDRRALRELHRVLSAQGALILCVPITFGRAETVDFGGPDPRLNDHCFDYGEDFPDRLTEAGFSGESYRIDELVPAALHRELALASDIFFVLRRAEPDREAHIERRTAAQLGRS